MVAISDQPIPSHLLDLDFQVAANQAGRMTGLNQKTDQRKGVDCPLFGEAFRDRIIPRSDWDDVLQQHDPAFGRLDHFQYDQDGEGTCTANACSASVAQKWNERYGEAWHIAPAPPSVYQFCANSGNSGSTTSCILKTGRDRGFVLIDTAQNRKVLTALGLDPSHVIRAVGWNQSIRGMEETAKQIRIAEFYEIDGVDEFFSALILGFPILYGRSGHAIKGTDIVKRNGVYACKYRNSWGVWGDDGYGYDSLDYIHRTNAPYGAYAVQSLIVPDGAGSMIGAPTLKG